MFLAHLTYLKGAPSYNALVGCIIVMSGAPPEQTTSIRTTYRSVLISKLVVCSVSVLALSARACGPCLCPSEDQDRRKYRSRESVFLSHLVGNSGADSICENDSRRV